MDCKCLTLVISCLAAAVRGEREIYDYCDPNLKLCEVATDHTMCKYPVPGLSPQCIPGVNEPLNSTEKERILFLHNKFRSHVAEGTEKNKVRKLPLASNMRQLYWDGELENIAARWANQCTPTTSGSTHDICRNAKRFQVSQNVGTRRANGSTIDKQAPQIVIAWYKEGKDFDPSLVDSFPPNEDVKTAVRQFANIIWADTYAVGCARVIFQEQLPRSDKDKGTLISSTERLVCNYGPGGNNSGKPIYKRGAPCENCPVGTKCSSIYPGLCASQSAEKLKEQQKIQDAKTGGSGETAASSTTFTTTSTTEGLVTEAEENLPTTEQECLGDECSTKSNERSNLHLNEILKFPRPTARKKSLEVGFMVPSHGDDIVIEKEKWIVSNRRKVRRGDSPKKLKNGDSCKCYIASEDSGSSRAKQNIFLLLFSVFITVECFLYHTAK